MVTFNARRSARISVDKLGQRPKQDTSALELEGSTLSRVDEPTNSPELKSDLLGDESLAFRKLASKNPALIDLVAALDLVEVSSTIIKPEPLPPLPERLPLEPANPKLIEIAQLTFARYQTYSEAEAVERLATLTNVTTDRARNGVALMYDQCILSLTLSNEYYLAESNPF